MKALRRQLRTWKQEIGSSWARLSSFHRTALGIALAIAMVLVVRKTVLDPLKDRVTKIITELEDGGVPPVVSTPEEDNEIQELELQIENLERTLITVREDEAAIVREFRPLRLEERSAAIAETGKRLSRSGLRVQSIEDPALARQKDGKAPAQSPRALTSSVNAYAVQGSFAAVHHFLKEMDSYPWPMRVEGVSISIMTGENGLPTSSAGDPLVELRFNQRLLYYDYERTN